MTTQWRSFGASVIGPSHVATMKPNQDAWLRFHHTWGDGIVVSDGLGSKPLSNIGSEFACQSVIIAARRIAHDKTDGKQLNLATEIVTQWLHLISPLDPSDTAATCLFAIRLGDGVVRIGILGDGCAVAVKKDGDLLILAEDKSKSFSNVTVALSAETKDKFWTLREIPESECEAVVLCTDGVSDDIEDLEGFINGLVTSHQGFSCLTASRRLFKMIEGWPVPKHSDDKTIACLFQHEVSND